MMVETELQNTQHLLVRAAVQPGELLRCEEAVPTQRIEHRQDAGRHAEGRGICPADVSAFYGRNRHRHTQLVYRASYFWLSTLLSLSPSTTRNRSCLGP